ncbi:DNA polymerase III subunit delta [Streptococcus chenjunshii]|uniref:DNA polymerase III subunit delta n=1 Tax=Streptococcus chenjunshii TaxID=2173853 RepID=A0A372KKP4_9STRE|nr:DNA polymerase III subunit delta [Streptococcus chenjunshii]AXQ78270.1 DNA polymerase III subunit delta [Streptococcus chenjunshii]RFU50717.1 DNA polymerase III subunit delta [Streptococcus chenjunshii]RFU52882.1 DNA polymerase III subunit delta [Streptococcus chenjunshii]
MLDIEKINQLTKEKLLPVTVLSGEDLGQYSQMKQLLMEQIGFDITDLSYSYFDMAEADYQEAELDLESLPFFADEKIVVFDNLLDITTAKKSFLEPAALKRLEAYIENPVSSTRLIILAPAKLDGKRRMVKLLKRDAQIFEAGPVKEAELKTYFQKLAHQQGLVFEKGVFDELLLKSNFDFSDIMKNLLFLKAYKKDGHIEASDVAEAIPKTLQDNIFEMTQLVLGGKIDAARDLVRDLRLQGEDDIKLIAVMLGQFRMFTQVKILSVQGKNEQQITADLSAYLGRRVNPYQVKFALRDSRTLSLSFLKQVLADLIEADYMIKQGRYDKDYLFDLVLLKIAGSRSQ